jgi:hypothetical protein
MRAVLATLLLILSTDASITSSGGGAARTPPFSDAVAGLGDGDDASLLMERKAGQLLRLREQLADKHRELLRELTATEAQQQVSSAPLQPRLQAMSVTLEHSTSKSRQQQKGGGHAQKAMSAASTAASAAPAAAPMPAPSPASQQKGEASLSRADLEAELEQLKHRLARNTETLQAQLLSAQVREQRHVERALAANMTAAVAQVRVFRRGVALLKASRPDCPHPCVL